jgi:hypothetical protein
VTAEDGVAEVLVAALEAGVLAVSVVAAPVAAERAAVGRERSERRWFRKN